MDIYVFDKSFNLLGIIDSYSSLIWSREYYNIGTFELHTVVNEHHLTLLQKENILVKETSLEEAMYIDSIYMSHESSESMKVKGFSIDNFLEDRISWGTRHFGGTPEGVIRAYVGENCVTPEKVARKIPNLIMGGWSNPPIEGNVEEIYTDAKLAELVKELANKYDVGWRIKFDRDNKKFVFEVYRGTDWSVEQTVNPVKTFSSEYENIFNQTYSDSDTTLKTMALVKGTGEEPDRQIVLIGDELTGFDRKEVYVDANDIQDKDEDGNPIPQDQYLAALKERGLSKLSEATTIRTFESDVSVLSNLAYRIDFDLGDKVTIVNEKWGLVLSTRITSVEEVYENNVMDIRVNFGSIIPTIKSILNKAVK